MECRAERRPWACAPFRSIKEVWAYDIVRKQAERYVREMSDKLGLPVKVATSAEEAVRRADVICTATTSKTPMVKREWLKAGVHINAIGALRPDMQELEAGSWRRQRWSWISGRRL